jgi:TetR/AcrR family transcriptional regulator, tetracycline repressor protein
MPIGPAQDGRVPKKNEPGLDRTTIVDTALRLLDEVGLDGLTLRRLAHELGVQAPALYWHVKNKQELLDLMAARITSLADHPKAPAPGQAWSAWLTELAIQQRHSLLAHRDGAKLVAGTRPFESMFDIIEQMLASLVEVGFTPGQAVRGVTTMNMYVGGFVLEEQAEQSRWQESGTLESDEEAFGRLAGTGRWPMVVSAFAESGDPNGDEAFADGVAMIVAGMREVLDARPEAERSRTAVPR